MAGSGKAARTRPPAPGIGRTAHPTARPGDGSRAVALAAPRATPSVLPERLPDALREGIESLSGLSMHSVKVHYNAPGPARFGALAYAQGAHIHLAPGQQQHLPHEAWHVVQQAQGRVAPRLHIGGLAINDDPALEQEADRMGARAAQFKPGPGVLRHPGLAALPALPALPDSSAPVQRKLAGLAYYQFLLGWPAHQAAARFAADNGADWADASALYNIALCMPAQLGQVLALRQLAGNDIELIGLLQHLGAAGVARLLADGQLAPLVAGLGFVPARAVVQALGAPLLGTLGAALAPQLLADLTAAVSAPHLAALQTATVTTLAPALGAARFKAYVDALGSHGLAALDALARQGRLLAGLDPVAAVQLIDDFGADGLRTLAGIRLADLALLATASAEVRHWCDADALNHTLLHLSMQAVVNVCTAIDETTFDKLLDRMGEPGIHDLAQLPDVATIGNAARDIVALAQNAGIGWDALQALGSDSIRVLVVQIGLKPLTDRLRVIEKTFPDSHNLGSVLRTLVLNLAPDAAAATIMGGVKVKDLARTAAAADKFAQNKATLQGLLLARAALFNALDDAALKPLLQGMTAPQAGAFILALNNALQINTLAVNIKAGYLKTLTGPHAAALLLAMTPAKLKLLALKLSALQLADVAATLPTPALIALSNGLSVDEFADFASRPNAAQLLQWFNRYTTASLKYYGVTFFGTFIGVTDAETMHHVRVGAGFKLDKLSGCHDRATFNALPGKAVITDIARVGAAGIFDATYRVNGYLAVRPKTLIDGLAGAQALWKARAVAALDHAIAQQTLDTATKKWQGDDGAGHVLEGYFGTVAGIADTFWVR